MPKWWPYSIGDFETAFARAKRTSDFVAFLSRLAMLSVLLGFVEARMDQAPDFYSYWSSALAWLALSLLAVHLSAMVLVCVYGFAGGVAGAVTDRFKGIAKLLIVIVVAAVIVPTSLGFAQLGSLAQSWGKRQAEAMLHPASAALPTPPVSDR